MFSEGSQVQNEHRHFMNPYPKPNGESLKILVAGVFDKMTLQELSVSMCHFDGCFGQLASRRPQGLGQALGFRV